MRKASPTGDTAPWLLRQKVTIPEAPSGYVHRAELLARAMPTRRRLTLLKASGGFGKTTLLAECCRRLRQEGVATAWVSVDERDEPAVLDAYIAFACVNAGLDFAASNADDAPVGPGSRIGWVVRGIEALGRPFVIAFDELERLSHPGSLSLVAFLLERGPPNLHLAVACREIPDGFDAASTVIDGRAETLDAEHLRFRQADVARFFDLRLSRRALSEETSRSAGWPFALRVSRNRAERPTTGSGDIASNVARNWIESRLLAGLGVDDRRFVLDLGLFGWIDGGLLDEVLQRQHSMRRLESLAVLEGLLEPVSDGTAGSFRLHPLVKEHCAAQRLREDPDRFRTVHRRIAAALATRGDPVVAMHHAVEGGEPFLAGKILERAGGVRLWIRHGVVQLHEADRLLSDEVLAQRPRLKLVRCAALTLSGRQHEARSLYAECPHPAGGEGHAVDPDYSFDHVFVRSAMALYGGTPVGSDWLRTLHDNASRLARSREVDPFAHGNLDYGLCVQHFLRGEFDSALASLSAARELTAGAEYIVMYGEVVHSQIEFVRGRAQDARAHCRKARRIARGRFLLDPVATRSCAVVMKEITLERSLAASVKEPPGLRKLLMTHGVPFSLFATAANVLIDTRLRSGHIDEALAATDELLGYLHGAGFTTFARLLAALRVSVLVLAGRMADADRAWRRAALPEDAASCVSLANQSWREMEAVAEARVRVLMARQRFEEARALVGQLHAVAVERGFRRTEMRSLALSIALEQQSGEMAASRHALVEYLRLFTESAYAWPLLREAATCAALVRRYLLDPGTRYRQTAHTLLEAMVRADGGRQPLLSERERAVLRQLPGHRDKEIAAALGLSVHGVRHHLRKLFAKLGVAKRADAVRRAKELGLIPDAS